MDFPSQITPDLWIVIVTVLMASLSLNVIGIILIRMEYLISKSRYYRNKSPALIEDDSRGISRFEILTSGGKVKENIKRSESKLTSHPPSSKGTPIKTKASMDSSEYVDMSSIIPFRRTKV